MVKAVVLDGFHRKSVVCIPHALPTLRLPRTTTLRCTEFSVENHVMLESEYKLVFMSVDGQVALYSITGNSEDFLNCDAVHVACSENPLFGMKRSLNYFVPVERKQP
jgi:hypothetical protein